MPSKKKKPVRKVTKKRPVRRKPLARRKVSAKKKPVAKKRALAKKKAPAKKAAVKQAANVIGLVTHYFPHVQAAVIKLKAPLSQGETIRIKGHTTDFTQTISSMQIDHVSVAQAKKGAEIGVLVNSRVRQHDIVTKV